jgi:hypothetical protein
LAIVGLAEGAAENYKKGVKRHTAAQGHANANANA